MYFFGGYTKVTEEMFDSLRWRASLFCNRVREMCNWCPSNLGCCCVWELITSSGALPPILKVAPKRKVMSEFLDRLLIHNILVFRCSGSGTWHWILSDALWKGVLLVVILGSFWSRINPPQLIHPPAAATSAPLKSTPARLQIQPSASPVVIAVNQQPTPGICGHIFSYPFP